MRSAQFPSSPHMTGALDGRKPTLEARHLSELEACEGRATQHIATSPLQGRTTQCVRRRRSAWSHTTITARTTARARRGTRLSERHRAHTTTRRTAAHHHGTHHGTRDRMCHSTHHSLHQRARDSTYQTTRDSVHHSVHHSSPSLLGSQVFN